MKVTLIVSAVTVVALGILYIVAQPNETTASHSLSKTSQSSMLHRGDKEI